MSKLLITVSAVLSAASLMATDYAAVSFASSGTDTYADGTLVPDGEIYALCWSAGEFGGFNVDGTLKNSEDLVVPVALNKGAGAVVNLPADSKYVTSGSFAVYLLDTRTFAEDGTSRVTPLTAAGKLARVNSSSKLDVAVEPKAGDAPAGVTAGAVAKDEAVGSALPDDMPMPVITKMDIAGDLVKLTVDQTVPCVNYAVKGGATPAADGKVGAAVTGNGSSITLVYPKSGETAFLKVVRSK